MNIKRNIIFSLESRKKNDKPIILNVPIRMRVIYNSKRIEFTTGYRIDVAKWDEEKQRVKNGCTNKLKQTAAEINADLNRYYSLIQEIFKEFEVRDVMPTPAKVKEAFAVKCGDTSDTLAEASFFGLWDEFLKDEGNIKSWAKGTITIFKTLKKHLTNFDPDLTFETLDEAKLGEFITYLREDKQMRNSTLEKHLRFLKWYLRWAIRKGYTTNRAFEDFRPNFKIADKGVTYLSWDELMALRDFQIPESKQYLERVRDVFLFCCFTGLRYSDVENLKRSDIKDTHIEITAKKTVDSLKIPLNKYSSPILAKYEALHWSDNKVLPVISNQKMNKYLKELCKLAEMDETIRETFFKGNERFDIVKPKHERICTHDGRRTFICNSLIMGIPAEVVMKITGHKDYNAMKPYIAIADSETMKAMEVWNKKDETSSAADKLLKQLKDAGMTKDELLELLKEIK